MSVTKYRSAAEMPPPARVAGAALAATIRAVWERARRLAPPAFTPGVQKFADLEAAQRAREFEQKARVRSLRTLRVR